MKSASINKTAAITCLAILTVTGVCQTTIKSAGLVGSSGNATRNGKIAKEISLYILRNQVEAKTVLERFDNDLFDIHVQDELIILIDKDLGQKAGLKANIAMMEFLLESKGARNKIYSYDALPDDVKQSYKTFVGRSGNHKPDMTGHTFTPYVTANANLTLPNGEHMKFSAPFSDVTVKQNEKGKETLIELWSPPNTIPFQLGPQLRPQEPTVEKDMVIGHVDIFMMGRGQAEYGDKVADFYYNEIATLRDQCKQLAQDAFTLLMGQDMSYYGGALRPEGQRYDELPEHIKIILRGQLTSMPGGPDFTDPITGFPDIGRIDDFLSSCNVKIDGQAGFSFDYQTTSGKTTGIGKIFIGSGG